MAIALLVSPPARAAAGVTAGLGLRRQLRLLPLVMVFFFTVAGGAYGLLGLPAGGHRNRGQQCCHLANQ